MAKMIRHDYSAIHDALNKMIIAEVKAALEQMPEQEIEGPSLCRIVVSVGDDYEPKDVAVDRVWLHKDRLYFYGHIMPLPDDGNIEPDEFEGGEGDEETAETDWIDITDFGYLIDQIAEKVEGEHDIRMKEPGNLFYSERKIYDRVRWIDPDGVEVETGISGILAEKEPDEPTEIIYTTNLRRGNKLHTVYLTEDAILKD